MRLAGCGLKVNDFPVQSVKIEIPGNHAVIIPGDFMALSGNFCRGFESRGHAGGGDGPKHLPSPPPPSG